MALFSPVKKKNSTVGFVEKRALIRDTSSNIVQHHVTLCNKPCGLFFPLETSSCSLTFEQTLQANGSKVLRMRLTAFVHTKVLQVERKVCMEASFHWYWTCHNSLSTCLASLIKAGMLRDPVIQGDYRLEEGSEPNHTAGQKGDRWSECIRSCPGGPQAWSTEAGQCLQGRSQRCPASFMEAESTWEPR